MLPMRSNVNRFFLVSSFLPAALCVALMFPFLAGCGGKQPAPPSSGGSTGGSTATAKKPAEATAGAEKPAAPAVSFDAENLGTIKGKVVLDGEVPERLKIDMSGDAKCAAHHEGGSILDERIIAGDGGVLKNFVVYINNAPAGAPVKADTIMIDQVGCQYVPHVLAMMTGQTLTVKSSDDTSHNVNFRPAKNSGDNFAMQKDETREVNFKREEMIRFKCDIHNWMSAQVAVFDHPYFAVSSDDGTFEITGVPAGEYELWGWHEELANPDKRTRPLKEKVKVEAKGAAEVTLTVKAK